MFKKIVILFQDYFGVSRKEARGALALIVLCVVLIWTPFIFRRYILPVLPPGSEPLTEQKLDSIVAKIESENALKQQNRRKFPKRNFEAKPGMTVKLVRFDPNTATVNELNGVGIPLFLARRIDKFRSKGGKFRKKEDLLNIYDFPSDLYQKLENYIVLPASQVTNLKEKLSTKTPDQPSNTTSLRSGKPAVASFDINAADTTHLVKLKGIGTKLSMRILKFRDGLGGFYSKDQFAEIFGLDSLALSELHRYADIAGPIRKIRINTATAEELGSHSYLKNKKLVSIIINYRNQHGKFSNSDDLRKIRVLDEKLIEKLTPYLSFED
ncbi:ComEA family DNA-binding protein [Dyadobacter aurulentus]|uniref:ComEA family DNA-binding protein n=1 Tax=Dyadobacter sp. UC 10 TaxID=2605428 RepID=UPI0011F267B3|nr:helix-hairpin-helix domain-containing protein [Dyadobacter sp. UC 10]KAA0989575.1 helix-hairpin-helix domain-containing protein [Dyadobacter sp. UC 10]